MSKFLYHGTSESTAQNILQNGVMLTIGRKNIDFGQGFYLAQIRGTAITWAVRQGRRYHENGVFLYFTLNANDLKLKFFKEVLLTKKLFLVSLQLQIMDCSLLSKQKKLRINWFITKKRWFTMTDKFMEKFYKVTAEELSSRGYSTEMSKSMVKNSNLAKYMDSDERWAYTHDMDVSDWADWIEEENGLKEPPVPIWKVQIA